MRKLSKTDTGFTAVEGLIVIVIVVFLGFAGWFVYKQHHDMTTPTVASITMKPIVIAPTPALASSFYASWKSYCDPTTKFCLNYPKTWSTDIFGGLASGSNNPGTLITISGVDNKTCSQAIKSGGAPTEATKFYTVSVNKVSSSALPYEVVGGYTVQQGDAASNTGTTYQPEYVLLDTSLVKSYGFKIGAATTVPFDPFTCIDYGTNKSTGMSSATSDSASNSDITPAQATDMLSSAKETLEIMQSIYPE